MTNTCEYCGEQGTLELTNYDHREEQHKIQCCENCRRFVKSVGENFLVTDTFVCKHCDESFHNDDMSEESGYCNECNQYLEEQDEPTLSARERN